MRPMKSPKEGSTVKVADLNELRTRLLLDIFENGPDCAKFISRRHKISLRQAMDELAEMERLGWLERVKGTFLMKKGLKRPKHMNHTYYDLSRSAELYLRENRRKRR